MNNIILSYICSDLHLQEGQENISLLINLIKSLKSNEELIINGDIFDVFIGKEKAIFPWQKELLQYFEKAKKEGKKISYIEGNRDFLINNFEGKYFYSVYNKECYKNNNSILIIHGDKINKKDYLYRFWNIFSKNNFIFYAFTLLPTKVIQRIIIFLEKKMKLINKKYKEQIQEDQIINFIKNTKPEVKLIISGHFHKYFHKNIDGKNFVALPSWKKAPYILKINSASDYDLLNLSETNIIQNIEF